MQMDPTSVQLIQVLERTVSPGKYGSINHARVGDIMRPRPIYHNRLIVSRNDPLDIVMRTVLSLMDKSTIAPHPVLTTLPDKVTSSRVRVPFVLYPVCSPAALSNHINRSFRRLAGYSLASGRWYLLRIVISEASVSYCAPLGCC